MDLRSRGRVAIVAAASKGLGRAVAEESAREGAEIAIYARTPADLEAAAERIRLAGCRQVFWEALDVSDAAAITAFVASVERSFGRVDICVTIPAGLRLNCSWPPPRKVGVPGPTNC